MRNLALFLVFSFANIAVFGEIVFLFLSLIVKMLGGKPQLKRIIFTVNYIQAHLSISKRYQHLLTADDKLIFSLFLYASRADLEFGPSRNRGFILATRFIKGEIPLRG